MMKIEKGKRFNQETLQRPAGLANVSKVKIKTLQRP